MGKVHVSRLGDVVVLTLDNPPVNSFDWQQRRLLVQAIDAAAEDEAVVGIVVTGAGEIFSGGADIREFGKPEMMASPHLLDVIDVAEGCCKPVVAAINGLCLGGGLEFSLGCHGRVAQTSARVGLPEVKIGLLPGAGGTQRLPRAVGLELAMDMIVSGEPMLASRLAQTALFDAVVEQDVVAEAAGLARRLAQSPSPLPKIRNNTVDHPAPEAFLSSTRATVLAQFPRNSAQLQCVEGVAGSLTPFVQGLARERRLFLAQLAMPESQALRHAFFAERAASKISDVPADTPIRPIDTVGVVGAGTMGRGIALTFLNVGIPVTLVEPNAEVLHRAVTMIRDSLVQSVQKGKIAQEVLEARLELLTPTPDLARLSHCDLIVEAVFEDIRVKQDVFEQLDRVAKPGAILASNTSTLDLNVIAGWTRRPEDVVGLHFFSPAHVMRLLEVVRGAATGRDVLATAVRLAKTLGKIAVIAGVCDGFIGNRMLEHYLRMATLLVEEGASPRQVDHALETWGMAMGPFRMSDLAGNDIGWAVRKRRYAERPELKFSGLADRLCERGRFGQKTGAGWYRYEPGKREAIADPEVEMLIADYRRHVGVAPRDISAEEIVERCVYALVNEGARILQEGYAQRASDIDVVYLAGYGFPAWRGGPLFYADTVGLFMVARRMLQFASQSGGDGHFWQPAPLLAELVAQRGAFTAC